MRRHLHLAILAFQKAIDLGSPQAAELETRIKVIQTHIHYSEATTSSAKVLGIFVISIPGLLLILVFRRGLVKLGRRVLGQKA
jgi:hypothetical protein